MSALYIHIPFCKTKCNYCDFYKSISQSKAELYIEALEREMLSQKEFLVNTQIKTIYFGGGTPSIYSPSVIQRLINKAASIWNIDDVQEITIEVNPDDINATYLRKLASTNINRISIGIQSFIDRDLKLMGRRHSAQQAIDAIKRIQDKGYNNISADLIFGIPGMTLKEWESNVLTMMLLEVQHLSAYSLTISDGTIFGSMVDKGTLIQAEDKDSEDQFMLAHHLLEDGNYNHYEISNYSMKDKFRSKHNSSYWNGDIYLGLGPSAHSYDGDKRIYSESNLERYLTGAGTNNIYSVETLTNKDKYNEFIMTSLRTSDGIDREVLTQKFGIDALLLFELNAQNQLIKGGLIREKNTYKIPVEKLMISNNIISDLFSVE